MIAYDPNGGSTNNDNPYDIYGGMHNAGSVFIADNLISYTTTDNKLKYNSIFDSLRNYAKINYSSTITNADEISNSQLQSLIDIFEEIPEGNYGNYNDMLDGCENGGYITSEENLILSNYFDIFTTTDHPINYSIDAENLITNSDELTDSTKKKILIGMSVARNSYMLWD